MTHIRLIDVNVTLPDDVTLSTEPPSECRILHTLEGTSILEVRAAIEQAAAACGYVMLRIGSDSLLERNGQRIEIFAASPSRLRLRVDDAERLPYSRVTEDGISLGRMFIAIRGASEIQSGRERHDEGSNSWTAEWRVRGKNADELASEVHQSLLQQGLRSNGIWAPPKGGLQRWRVEAYSPRQLVKASISEESGSVALSVTLNDDTESA